MSADRELRPCGRCGFRIPGGNLCSNCREYGPPRDFRWEYTDEGKPYGVFAGRVGQGETQP